MLDLTALSVGPDDLALGFAFPLTREAFLADLHGETQNDFVKANYGPLLSSGRGVNAEYCWETYRRGVVGIAIPLLDEAAAAGAAVFPELRLAELGALFASRRVVILMAHWKGALVAPADIADPKRLLAIIEGTDLPVGGVLRRLVMDAQAAPGGNLRDQLAQALSEFIISATIVGLSEEPEVAGGSEGLPNEQREYQLRAALETLLEGTLRNGNRVEVRDALVAPGTVETHLPRPFQGILDLSVCNSILLGQELRRWRPQEGVFVVNQAPTNVPFRLAFYRQIIQLLSGRKRPYLQTLYDLRKSLIRTSK